MIARNCPGNDSLLMCGQKGEVIGMIYRVTGKSQEPRGAGQANIIELGFASDADATTFATNVNAFMQGDVVSVDSEIVTDYSLPYPAGTNTMVRFAMFDGVAHWSNQAIKDIKTGFDDLVRGPALIAAGALIWNPILGTFYVPSVINIAPFTPGASV